MPTPSPPDPDDGYATHVETGRGSANGTPRWVKVSGIVALLLVLLVVVLLLVGGGSHGPGRHAGGATPSGVTGDQSPSGGGLGAHTPPPGGDE